MIKKRNPSKFLPKQPKIKCVEINWPNKYSDNIKDSKGRFFDGSKFYNTNFTIEYESINEKTNYYYLFKFFGQESVVYSSIDIRGKIAMIKSIKDVNEFEYKLPNKINEFIKGNIDVYMYNI